MNVREPDLAVHDLTEDHIVLELHERLMAPGPALELHIVQDTATGTTAAWWEDDEGGWLGEASVGEA